MRSQFGCTNSKSLFNGFAGADPRWEPIPGVDNEGTFPGNDALPSTITVSDARFGTVGCLAWRKKPLVLNDVIEG